MTPLGVLGRLAPLGGGRKPPLLILRISIFQQTQVVVDVYPSFAFARITILIKIRNFSGMQELEEFLEKQRDLNVKMIQDLLSTQSLLQHNLSMGLVSLKKCVQVLPSRRMIQQGYSRLSLSRQAQHAHILKSMMTGKSKRRFELEGEIRDLYRERMFSIAVRLVGDCEEREDDQWVQLKLFTSEKFPQEVSRNVQGKPIFKGVTQLPLKYQVVFNKLQITDVSSHFPNGKFILVIYSDSAQPLIIDNIIVKAKKMDKSK